MSDVIARIIERTASEITHDAVMTPKLAAIGLLGDKEAIGKITANVTQVLVSEYMSGCLQIPIMLGEGDDEIAAYGVVFKAGDKGAFLHKVFTSEKHRGAGCATEIIKAVTEQNPTIWLMCLNNLVGFYEKRGFRKREVFDLKLASDGGMGIAGMAYCGAQVMQYGDSEETAFYLLKDKDFYISGQKENFSKQNIAY